MPSVSIFTSYYSTATAADGKFSIPQAKNNDTLRVTGIGYKTYKKAIGPKTDTLTVYLRQVSVMLRAVTVRAHRDYTIDSLRNRRDFAKEFNYTGPKFMDAFITYNPDKQWLDDQIHNPNTAVDMVRINVLQVVGLFTKNKNPATKLHQELLADEENNYVDHVFSKAKITSVTNLKGDSLLDFMADYRPTAKQVRKMTDYDITVYIKNSYAQFKKTYKPGERSFLSKQM